MRFFPATFRVAIFLGYWAMLHGLAFWLSVCGMVLIEMLVIMFSYRQAGPLVQVLFWLITRTARMITNKHVPDVTLAYVIVSILLAINALYRSCKNNVNE